MLLLLEEVDNEDVDVAEESSDQDPRLVALLLESVQSDVLVALLPVEVTTDSSDP